MKVMKHKISSGLAMAVLILLGGTGLSYALTSDLTIQSFDANDNGVGNWYGSGVYAWDGTQDNTGNGGGSLSITVPNDSSSDTPLNPFICMNGGNPWWDAANVDLTLYSAVDFDIKWDNSGVEPLGEFNDTSTWPSTFGTPVGQFDGDPYSKGFNLKAVSPTGPNWYQLGSTNVPAGAAIGWAHVHFPIDPTIPGISADINGIDLEKWNNNHGNIVGANTAHFWIDNLVLKGTAAPPPPPTVEAPNIQAVPGLNVWNTTEGNTFYDRQEAELIQSSGLTWVGHPGATYSFTIAGYPQSENCEAYLFLVPNPANVEAAPDYNEAACAVLEVQGDPFNATGSFSYKTNEPSSETYTQVGNVHPVANTTGVFGTWQLVFADDTDLTLIAPDGTPASYTLPPAVAAEFAESSGFNVYLGGQANNANAMNQAVVYSNVGITGTASPYSENFLTDASLNPAVWNVSVSGGPKGVFVAPAGSALVVDWTLPAGGFGLQVSDSEDTDAVWTGLTEGPVFSLYGKEAQVVNTSELPGGNDTYFRLIKRIASQLEILLPGQSNVVGVGPSGNFDTSQVYVGAIVNVTVNLVDATFNIVNAGDSAVVTAGPDDVFGATDVVTITGGTGVIQIQINDSPDSLSATDANSLTGTTGSFSP
jgi:hypothetical protein